MDTFADVDHSQLYFAFKYSRTSQISTTQSPTPTMLLYLLLHHSVELFG